MKQLVETFIEGRAVPQGSMNAGVTKTGRPFVYPANKNLKAWRQRVCKHLQPLATPPEYSAYSVELIFWFKRPKAHFGTSGGRPYVKDSSPSEHVTKPDLDKLVRAIFDGMTDAGVVPDDSHVIALSAKKQYCLFEDDEEGVSLEVWGVPDGEK